MTPEKAQQLAKDTDIQIQNLQKDRLPLVNVLDIYAEDGFVIGPDEILNAFNNFETATLPSRVEALRQSIISSLTEMNRIVEQAQLERKLEHERMDLAVAELKAKLFDNIRQPCI